MSDVPTSSAQLFGAPCALHVIHVTHVPYLTTFLLLVLFGLIWCCLVLFGPKNIKNHFDDRPRARSEEHTSELQSQSNLVCRLLLEKKEERDCLPPHGRESTLLHVS